MNWHKETILDLGISADHRVKVKVKEKKLD